MSHCCPIGRADIALDVPTVDIALAVARADIALGVPEVEACWARRYKHYIVDNTGAYITAASGGRIYVLLDYP